MKSAWNQMTDDEQTKRDEMEKWLKRMALPCGCLCWWARSGRTHARGQVLGMAARRDFEGGPRYWAWW